jgi:hypothetical protein
MTEQHENDDHTDSQSTNPHDVPDDPIPDEAELHQVNDEHGPETAAVEQKDLLHLSFLMDTKSRVKIIDWLLVGADEERWYSKAALAREADVARNSIVRHIDILVEFGLVEVQGEKNPRYRPYVESPTFQALFEANHVLQDVVEKQHFYERR